MQCTAGAAQRSLLAPFSTLGCLRKPLAPSWHCRVCCAAPLARRACAGWAQCDVLWGAARVFRRGVGAPGQNWPFPTRPGAPKLSRCIIRAALAGGIQHTVALHISFKTYTFTHTHTHTHGRSASDYPDEIPDSTVVTACSQPCQHTHRRNYTHKHTHISASDYPDEISDSTVVFASSKLVPQVAEQVGCACVTLNV